uniref:Uncharacterized protein n=1 Tax=Maylandia zebra TaxID=106582 RepID=A0A3P9BZ85_9CICH
KTTLHQHIECDQQPVVTALLGFAPVAVDGAMAHHLRHCPYHFRLFKTELVSSQELPESHYGGCCQCQFSLASVVAHCFYFSCSLCVHFPS